MLAKLKDTGEVVNIINLFDDGTAETEYHSYIKVSKLIFDFDDNDSDMPSENRMRYELSKAAMQGYCIALGLEEDSDTYRNIAIGSIRVADEMIRQLKKESEKKK